MAVKAIVYTSNTGYTGQYAQILGKQTGLEVYTLAEAVKQLPDKTEIIYLGWVMGGLIRGLNRAGKKFTVRAVCGVLMGASGSQIPEMRRMNKLPGDMPLFSAQGGFDMKKLKGIYKIMMKFMAKALIRNIESKAEQTPEDEKILNMLKNGGSCVCRENIQPVLDWYGRQ